jgi:pimeloyl-[acyl-carrier protein] synthase
MTLWIRFPPRMRRALAAALESAGTRGCDEMTIEHLSAAICRDEQSAASFIFSYVDLPRAPLLKQLEQLQPTGSMPRQRAPRLSSATLNLLNSAAAHADQWKHSHVGTEHVALALAESESPSGQTLRELGLTLPVASAGLRHWIAEKMPREGRVNHRPLVGRLSRWKRVVGFPVFAWKIFICKSLAHPSFVRDPYPLYQWLREKHPVRRDPLAPVWVVSRYADVTTMLKDSRFLKDPFAVARMPTTVREQLGISNELVPTSDVETISMLFLDPPQHTRVRALFSRAFTPKMIAGLRPRIQRIMDERLAPVLAVGEMDLIETIAYPLPVVVIAELLGFPAEDFPLYKKWSDDFTAALGINPTPAEQARATESRIELRAYFDQLVEKIQNGSMPLDTGRSEPNLITALLSMENEPGALSRDELFINAALLLAAGHETTTNQIANGMLALLKNPEQLARLRNDPALIESAVEELLRFDSPVQWVSRVVAKKLELSGVTLEPGDILLGSLGAANRDVRQFSDADRLDIARTDNRHLSFGSGVHFCLGAALARMEAQIAINTLVQRLPNLQLAERKVRWKKGIIFRAARELHLRFDPSPAR